MRASALRGHYEQLVDRESAYERLTQARRARDRRRAAGADARRTDDEDDLTKTAVCVGTSVARGMGTQPGRQIVRGVLGALFGGRRR